MQIFYTQLLDLPVISLQSGSRIATTEELVVDPARLAIAAFGCLGVGRSPWVLLPGDIRQLGPQGILVDSEEALAEPGDIVRLEPLLKQSFSPIGIKVVTELGRAVGKVETYTIAPEQFVVQKLHVHRPIWQSLAGASAIIDRAQVVDVSPQQIVVRDTEIPGALASAPAPEQS